MARQIIITVLILLLSLPLFPEKAVSKDLPLYTKWNTYYIKDGLPDNHIFFIKGYRDSLWIGTEGGLARYRNGKWDKWTEKDGLPWRVISALDFDDNTGDLWIGMFGGGIARFSGGRFDHFNQFNSGLANDVVYGISVIENQVWVATTAGVSSYDIRSKEWEIYTDKNSPMEEIWCYNADANDGKVYIAVWGGGVLEWDLKKKHWNAHRDPDREMEIDLFRDDGVIHNITTSVSYIDSILWVSTYFGFCRYDGRHWRGYMAHDSGLTSNFINYALGIDRYRCFLATDIGLSCLTDFRQNLWVNYRKAKKTDHQWTAFLIRENKLIRQQKIPLDLPNDHVLSVELFKNELWIGTGHGLARGRK